MFHRFRFESEFYPELSRLPLDVRRKLDLTGIKISLKEWLAFDFTERAALCHLPVESDEERQVFADYLDLLSRRHRDKPAERIPAPDSHLWDRAQVPDAVLRKSALSDRTVRSEEWSRWQAHERYALYKTANSNSQPEAFDEVLEELRERLGTSGNGDVRR